MGSILLQSDAVIVFVMFATFVVMTVVMVIGIFLMVRWIKRGERRAGARWADSARSLGLGLREAGPQNLSDLDQIRRWMGSDVTSAGPSTTQVMFGEFAGREVEVWIRQVRTSAYTVVDSSSMVQKKAYYTCCSARIVNRGGFAFRLKSRNADGFLTRMLDTAPGIITGFPPFDNAYQATADAGAFARVFGVRWGDGHSAAERFAGVLNSNWTIQATENEVRIEYPGMVLDAAMLRASLNSAAELAARVEHGIKSL